MNEFVAAFRARVDTATREPGMACAPLHHVEDLTSGPVPLRLYRPSPGPSPLLCYLHGAGFVAGDLDSHDQICRQLATRVGAVVVAVDYRRAPEHPFPAAVDDALAALRWTLDQAPSLGADPSRWAVVGDSAGGTLAAVAAQHWRGRPDGPRLQALVCPALDFADFESASHRRFAETEGFNTAMLRQMGELYLGEAGSGGEDGGEGGPVDRRDPRVSPARAEVLDGMAPAVIVSAELDPLRDDGETYARRLVEAGVPVTSFRHLGMVHYGVWWCRAAEEIAPGLDVVCSALACALNGPPAATAPR